MQQFHNLVHLHAREERGGFSFPSARSTCYLRRSFWKSVRGWQIRGMVAVLTRSELFCLLGVAVGSWFLLVVDSLPGASLIFPIRSGGLDNNTVNCLCLKSLYIHFTETLRKTRQIVCLYSHLSFLSKVAKTRCFCKGWGGGGGFASRLSQAWTPYLQ